MQEDGETRFKLEDIVGEQDGLGVENLRGSGLIAGETSAAYEDTFTLSSALDRNRSRAHVLVALLRFCECTFCWFW